MGQYLPVLAMAVLATLFAALSLAVSRLLAPWRPTPAKSAPYESGIVPTMAAPERFPVRFFLIAMSFIVFDIEIIFLFPWAVIYRELGPEGLVAVAIFVLPVLVSLVYEIANGAFELGPDRRRPAVPVSAIPVTIQAAPHGATVRLVGSEGREPRARSDQEGVPT